MLVVKEEFNQRVEEVDSHFLFLDKIINGNVRFIDEHRVEYSIKTTNHTISKSSSIILLYNLIESIITKCLMTIHEYMSGDSLHYHEMIPALKKMVLLYYNHMYSKRNIPSEAIESVLSGVELVLCNQCFNIPYLEMIKYYSLYSGNLDFKQIKKVFMNYGIQLEKPYPVLQKIKDYRNKLAHGEASFEECGRELSYQELDHFRIQTYDFITTTIDAIEKYLDQKKFRST